MNPETASFGNALEFEVIRQSIGSDAVLRNETFIIPRRELLLEAYKQTLEDISRSWTVLHDKQTGKTLEIAIGNPSCSTGDDIEESTLRSSLSSNSGNTKEFAEHVLFNPGRRRIYLANSGNGKSSFYDLAERKWLRKTGSFIGPEDTPLPTIAAKARMLQRAGIAPVRASVDSAGGAAITALSHALPEGQMTHLMIKSRPNIANHKAPLIWGARMALGDMRDDKALEKISEDPRSMTATHIAEVEAAIPRLYSPDPSVNAANIYPGLSKRMRLAKNWTDAMTYARGERRFNGAGPAARDTALALERQPRARITFYVPSNDRLYNDPKEDFGSFLQQVAHAGAVSLGNTIEVLHVPGMHSDHKRYPTLRASIEAYAFAR